MTLQWIRKARVLLGTDDNNAIEIKDLRMVFTTTQGIVEKPGTLDLKIYNVDPRQMHKIKAGYDNRDVKASKVRLYVSYALGEEALLFSGNAFQVRHARENATDTFMQVIATAEDIAVKASRMNTTLAAGTPRADVVKTILKQLEADGLPTGTPLPNLSQNKCASSVVLTKDCWTELKDYAYGCGCYCVVDCGKVWLIPLNFSDSKPSEAIVVNAQTGMVGMPQVTQQGIQVKCLLNPKHKLGRAIKLNNADIQTFQFDTAYAQRANTVGFQQDANGMPTGDKAWGAKDQDGIYRILAVCHRGDTRGNDWYTEMICTGHKAAQSVNAPVNTTHVNGPAT